VALKPKPFLPNMQDRQDQFEASCSSVGAQHLNTAGRITSAVRRRATSNIFISLTVLQHGANVYHENKPAMFFFACQ